MCIRPCLVYTLWTWSRNSALHVASNQISLEWMNEWMQWFLTKDDFAPGEQFKRSRDIFGCHNWDGATGIWWIEARDAAEHPTTTGQSLRTRLCRTRLNVSSAEVEKPWPRQWTWREGVLQVSAYVPSLGPSKGRQKRNSLGRWLS